MAYKYITISQQKLLHVKSGNRCTICKKILAEKDEIKSSGVNAHINGENPGSTRYDPNLSKDYINSEKNLIFICPNCHDKIDNISPQDYPPDRLLKMKSEHEESVRTLPRKSLDNEKIATYLTGVVNQLSSIEACPESDLHDRKYLDYEIKEKIDFNNIKQYEETINEYKIYQYYLHGENGLYKISVSEGGFEKRKIYNRIKHIYMEIINAFNDINELPPYSGDVIYFKGFNVIIQTIRNSKSYIEMNDDDLMHCVHIILVDAFIECKWFENPKNGGSKLGTAY